MTSLEDKLKALGVQIGAQNLSSPRKDFSFKNLPDVLGGKWQNTRFGDCFIVNKTISIEELPVLEKVLSRSDLSILSSLKDLETLPSIIPEDIIFIDTETTGLSGGSGTYVFLIGAARFIDGSIQLSQFFLQDPSFETGQLAAFEEFIGNSKLIVSYNGKSFDLPRIKNRFTIHRLTSPFRGIHHVDLLHIARRLWRNVLPGCTLGELESYLLNITRSDLDIPGWQVSDKFYEYLHSGDPTPLRNIFYHNEVDVLTLISLLYYLVDRLTNPLSKEFSDQPDLVYIGQFLSTLDQTDQAITVIQKALESDLIDHNIRLVGLLTLAKIFKRKGDYDLAIPAWIESAEIGNPLAYIELAKYYEHKIKDYSEAIHWTLAVLDLYQTFQSDAVPEQLIKQAKHRLERLKQKESKKTSLQ
jgi:uncharacterized protein YprB with RNaseH-like and TPR domain